MDERTCLNAMLYVLCLLCSIIVLCRHIQLLILVTSKMCTTCLCHWPLEPLPTCAARVDALRSHGHQGAALRLAVAVVRTMKQQQLVAQRHWHESQQQQQQQQHRSGASSSTANLVTPCTSRCTGGQTSLPVPSLVPHTCTGWSDGWVGHPLDPVGCLFDTLADASLIPDDQTSRTPSYFGKYEVIFLCWK